MIPISALDNNTDTLQIELDYYPLSSDSNMGIDVYQDNDNWGGLKVDHMKIWFYKKVNGTYSEAYTTTTSSLVNNWVHCKFIISETSISLEVYKDNSKVLEKSYDIPSTHSKIGVEASWATTGGGRFKNLQVKTL